MIQVIADAAEADHLTRFLQLFGDMGRVGIHEGAGADLSGRKDFRSWEVTEAG
jgi:hypothetical protein